MVAKPSSLATPYVTSRVLGQAVCGAAGTPVVGVPHDKNPMTYTVARFGSGAGQAIPFPLSLPIAKCYRLVTNKKLL